MNIMRNYQNEKFTYYSMKKNKKINNKHTLKRIKSLNIPPAYKNVEISEYPHSKIQAFGYDSKNRKQYIYNKSFIKQQSLNKFRDLILFGKKIKRIRTEYRKNIVDYYTDIENSKLYNSYPSLNYIIGVILYIIDTCNFRIGNEEYKKLYSTYGVTTLGRNHITFINNSCKIEFNGKKGVTNKNIIYNKEICIILKYLYELNLQTNNEYIFNYKDSKGNIYKITEKHINKYLKTYDTKLMVKMFRTWNANCIILNKLLNLSSPISLKEANKNINNAITKCADSLNNTNIVSKKNYINNSIISLYLNDFEYFKKIIGSFVKKNGKLPTIDRLLNLLLLNYINN
jgi:DNA topoisomerase-1